METHTVRMGFQLIVQVFAQVIRPKRAAPLTHILFIVLIVQVNILNYFSVGFNIIWEDFLSKREN